MNVRQIYPAHASKNNFVASTEERYYRYFNGRKYYVVRELEHYINPQEPQRNFWVHTVYALPTGKRRSTRHTNTSSQNRF